MLFILLITLICVLIPLNIYIFMKKNTKITPTSTTIPSPIRPSPSQITPTSLPPSADIKQELIATLKNTDYVYPAETFRIEYVYAADVFQIEILSEETETAKKQAMEWFKKQGVNQQQLCTLPLQIYPSFEIKNVLKTTNKTFNPLPPDC